MIHSFSMKMEFPSPVKTSLANDWKLLAVSKDNNVYQKSIIRNKTHSVKIRSCVENYFLVAHSDFQKFCQDILSNFPSKRQGGVVFLHTVP